MIKLPAGRTTISGQARQSRKTVPAARGAAFACATACLEAAKLQASARMMRRYFISVCSEIISDHLSILHDEPDPLELGDVRDRIAGNGNEVRKFSRLNGTDAVLPAQHFRGAGRNRPNHVERRHSGSMQIEQGGDT